MAALNIDLVAKLPKDEQRAIRKNEQPLEDYTVVFAKYPWASIEGGLKGESIPADPKNPSWYPAIVASPKSGWTGMVKAETGNVNVVWLGQDYYVRDVPRFEVFDFCYCFKQYEKKLPQMNAGGDMERNHNEMMQMLMEIVYDIVNKECPKSDLHTWMIQNASKYANFCLPPGDNFKYPFTQLKQTIAKWKEAQKEEQEATKKEENDSD